ncbi:MAG: LLM class F420-dependent oxidoreductase [Dehalococcoidia bacterium]|nr:LLM class F420-dependent oxidoreductase [Dehalococcoidia bacterium]
MKLGVTLPYDHTTLDPRALRDFVQAVEGLGWGFLAVPDHILAVDMSLRGTGIASSQRMGFRDPFVTLGYIAACTSRIELATAVLVLPQRQTALVAKQSAEVDVLSGGRLRLGIGVGWNAQEFAQLEQSFHDRGARMEEQVQVLQALWTQETVTFHGRWHHITEAGINPLPTQRPIPLWMGGSAEAALRRTGRLANAWLPEEPPGDALRTMMERLRGYSIDAGRGPASVDVYGRLSLRSGAPADWAKTAGEWQTIGATGVMVTTSGVACATIADHLDLLRRFKDALPA